MFGQILRNQFQAMGADVDLVLAGDRFEIDIDERGGAETYRLRLPSDGSVNAKVLHADRARRHLLLNVEHRGFGARQKYLCGHDEFHWFVAALPERSRSNTVLEAMEALKPAAVASEQRRQSVKRKHRSKRHTRAYVRQGEWFFLPRPEFVAGELRVESNGSLTQGAGKPHRVELLCRDQAARVFVRGQVSHPDHATIRFDVWHEVFRNTEVQAGETTVERERSRRQRELFVMRYVD